jgi:hypothetical protein
LIALKLRYFGRKEFIRGTARFPFALECKFHTGTLQLGLARAFLGLTEGITKPDRYLITNASSPNARKMVNHHKAEWEFELNLMDASVSKSLKARLQRAFRNYNTSHG